MVSALDGWTSFICGGSVYRFDTNLDRGGSSSATQVNIQEGLGYSWDIRTNLPCSLGYSSDAYDFFGNVILKEGVLISMQQCTLK
jgi:hypothetical protein